ncbi:hypothetical protein J3369_16075 [Alteromonas sp. NFXS44]|uniref:hypothetical protein n=1 Tax=Alteromonas sp. NFXS44 TaxID=2818435 RepID=UPI0032DF79D3
MSNALNAINNSLVNEANRCLDDIKHQPGVLRDLVRTFHDKKLYLHIGAGKYEDSKKGMRKCLKNELDDKRLYSSVCRWIQAFYVEDSVKLKKNAWPLTILLKFYRYKPEGWQSIADEFKNQGVPSMDEFENRCNELLENGEISLKREPRATDNKTVIEKFKQIISQLERNELMEIYDELGSHIDRLTSPSEVELKSIS